MFLLHIFQNILNLGKQPFIVSPWLYSFKQRVLNDLKRAGLSCGRMIPAPHPSLPSHQSPASKLDPRLKTEKERQLADGRGGARGVGTEQNHTTARKPDPL
jgi:hypothetical protein